MSKLSQDNLNLKGGMTVEKFKSMFGDDGGDQKKKK